MKWNKESVTTFVWGAVAGGIGLSIALFATGWAVRSDTAERTARMMSRDAVAVSLAQICVAQFEAAAAAAANKGEALAALKQIDAWQRGNYVNDHGWATMPGSESGTSQVAGECAKLLAEMKG